MARQQKRRIAELFEAFLHDEESFKDSLKKEL